jgi:release factor glutamine methyltransferase
MARWAGAARDPFPSILSPVEAMQVRTLLQTGLKILEENNIPSATLAAELLLMHTLHCDRAWLYTHPEAEVPPETARTFDEYLQERCTGKPTQYVTGHQEFWGLDFEVTPDVLIPRPETEHLVEAVLDISRRCGGAVGRSKVVDVGTGSGCIIVALARGLPQAELYGVDISTAALSVASRNARRLGFEGSIRFAESDLLRSLTSPEHLGTFDFVVSNPPYVGRDEFDHLQREVRDFEPRVALGDFETSEEIYRRLIPQAVTLLKPRGHLVLEIGYNIRDSVHSLLGNEWTNQEVRSDLAGIPRVICARKRL